MQEKDLFEFPEKNQYCVLEINSTWMEMRFTGLNIFLSLQETRLSILLILYCVISYKTLFKIAYIQNTHSHIQIISLTHTRTHQYV